jgi:hypothetical protein
MGAGLEVRKLILTSHISMAAAAVRGSTWSGALLDTHCLVVCCWPSACLVRFYVFNWSSVLLILRGKIQKTNSRSQSNLWKRGQSSQCRVKPRVVLYVAESAPTHAEDDEAHEIDPNDRGDRLAVFLLSEPSLDRILLDRRISSPQ